MRQLLASLLALGVATLALLPVVGGVIARGECLAFVERWSALAIAPVGIRIERYAQGWLESRIETRVWRRGSSPDAGWVLTHRLVHGPLLLGDLRDGRLPRWLGAAVETRYVPDSERWPAWSAAVGEQPLFRADTTITASGELRMALASDPARAVDGSFHIGALGAEVRAEGRTLGLSLHGERLHRDDGTRQVDLEALRIEADRRVVAPARPQGSLRASVGRLRLRQPRLALGGDDLELTQELQCADRTCDLALALRWSAFHVADEAYGALDCELAARGLHVASLGTSLAASRGGMSSLVHAMAVPGAFAGAHEPGAGRGLVLEVAPCRLAGDSGALELEARWETPATPSADGPGGPSADRARARLDIPDPLLHAWVERALDTRADAATTAFSGRAMSVAAARSSLLRRWEERGWLMRTGGRYHVELERSAGVTRVNGHPFEWRAFVQSLESARDSIADTSRASSSSP